MKTVLIVLILLLSVILQGCFAVLDGNTGGIILCILGVVMVSGGKKIAKSPMTVLFLKKLAQGLLILGVLFFLFG